jgi:hypothetical protein
VSTVWSTIGVLALGRIGWLVTSFVGRPFRQFFDLRSEVIHRSVLYANVAAIKKEISRLVGPASQPAAAAAIQPFGLEPVRRQVPPRAADGRAKILFVAPYCSSISGKLRERPGMPWSEMEFCG